MVSSIWDDIKKQFQHGDMVTRIIVVNVAVYIFVNVIRVILFFAVGREKMIEVLNNFLKWLEASPDLMHNLTRPWTIFTYMILHKDFFHILWNMLILYWFGRVFKELLGNQRVLPAYVLGGLGGYAAFVLSSFIPGLYGGVTPYMLGASAGVVAIVIGSAVAAPNYSMHLLLLGPVRLKYIAAFFILMYVFALPGGNTGGHFAHLGGALVGGLMIYKMQQGTDWAVPFNNIVDRILDYLKSVVRFFSGQRPGPKVAYRNPNLKNKRAKGSRDTDTDGEMSKQKKIDAILDKIKRSGYDSLSNEEKEFLFKASKEP